MPRRSGHATFSLLDIRKNAMFRSSNALGGQQLVQSLPPGAQTPAGKETPLNAESGRFYFPRGVAFLHVCRYALVRVWLALFFFFFPSFNPSFVSTARQFSLINFPRESRVGYDKRDEDSCGGSPPPLRSLARSPGQARMKCRSHDLHVCCLVVTSLYRSGRLGLHRTPPFRR